MDTKIAIELIRNALNGVSKSGVQFVQISALLTYLSDLERNAPLATEAVKFQHESNLAFYKSQQEADLEMFRSVVGAGKTAVTICILVNGGAAVALLTLIGNMYAKSQDVLLIKPSMLIALVVFSAAVLSAAVASGTSYLTQYCFHHKWQRSGFGFQTASILLIIMSYVLFGIGVVAAYHAFI